MPFIQSGKVRYLTFNSFSDHGLIHGAFTRHGGVSEDYLTSLNMGMTVGDQPENVIENRKISFNALGRKIESLSDSWLIHGIDHVVYDKPRPVEQTSPPQADIILTDNSDVTLFMRYADCAPLLLYDSKKRVIALAHAGWQGTVQHVGKAAVRAMQSHYKSDPKDILAVVGPAIGPEFYEVGEVVIDAVNQSFGRDAQKLLPKVGSTTHFDLWEANKLSLMQAGVEKIEVAGICTAMNTQDWFSHRAEKGETGRFGVILALED